MHEMSYTIPLAQQQGAGGAVGGILVNCVMAILVSLEIAKNFGKDVLFGLGLAFLGFIFYPILGFGDAKYRAG